MLAWLTEGIQGPFVEALVQDAQRERLAEFSVTGVEACGLGLAVLKDEPSLSANRRGWSIDPLIVRATYLSETGITDEDAEVCNLFSPLCFERRAGWFDERSRLAIRTGLDILRDAPGAFRWLQFAANAEGQIQKLRGNEPHFAFVVRHLAALSRQSEKWTGGPFAENYPFQCSPESQATLEQYGSQRSFICPDGLVRTFSWHSKIGVGAHRIYFHAEHPSQPVVVGYVGPHLPTASG